MQNVYRTMQDANYIKCKYEISCAEDINTGTFTTHIPLKLEEDKEVVKPLLCGPEEALTGHTIYVQNNY